MNNKTPVEGTGPPGRPVLPPQAEAEIMNRLYTNMRISSGEIAAILEKYDVCGDESGKREVLAHGSEYVVVECCNDRQALKAIRRRIQAQMSGLDVSAAKVQGRVHVLDRLLAKFRKAG